MANFETIKLDKGLYHTSKGFLNELESIDPSENYKGTALEGLDAFERRLKRFGIKVKGANSDTIDKFFATTDSAALFPEYISRAVYQGIKENSYLDDIVASKTNINALDYRTIHSNPNDTDIALQLVEEGAAIPETSVSTKENLVKLKKYGRMLVASYEAIRFQKLDLFTITLRQIGSQIARSQLLNALETIIVGDGNNNAAVTLPLETSGKISYIDLINLWNSFSGYNLNTIVASSDLMPTILTMPELRDSHAGLNFHGTGSMITPFGAKLIPTTALSGALIGLDKNYTLEMVTAGGVQTEHDKLIDRQLERTVISEISGFSKIFTDASKYIELA